MIVRQKVVMIGKKSGSFWLFFRIGCEGPRAQAVFKAKRSSGVLKALEVADTSLNLRGSRVAPNGAKAPSLSFKLPFRHD